MIIEVSATQKIRNGTHHQDTFVKHARMGFLETWFLLTALKEGKPSKL